MLKEKFKFTYCYVNPVTRCCDGSNKKSVIVFNDRNLSTLIKNAKYIISNSNDIYCIEIETLKTHKKHYVV